MLTLSSCAFVCSTLTNVNFDPTRFQEYISEAVQCRDALKAQYEAACADKGEVALTFDYPMTSWTPSAEVLADVDALYEEGTRRPSYNGVKTSQRKSLTSKFSSSVTAIVLLTTMHHIQRCCTVHRSEGVCEE